MAVKVLYDVNIISKTIQKELEENFPGLRTYDPMRRIELMAFLNDFEKDFFDRLIYDYFGYHFRIIYFQLYRFLKSEKVNVLFAKEDMEKINKLINLFEGSGIDFLFRVDTLSPTTLRCTVTSNQMISVNTTKIFYELLPYFGMNPGYYQTKEIFSENYNMITDPLFEKQLVSWFMINFDFNGRKLINHLNSIKENIIKILKETDFSKRI